MTPNFVVVVRVLLPISGHISWGMPYQCIFVEEVVTLLGAITDKWFMYSTNPNGSTLYTEKSQTFKND